MSPPSEEGREARLTDLLEEALGDGDRAEVEGWISEDPALAREVDDARAALALLQDLPERQPTIDLTRRIRRRVRRVNLHRGLDPRTSGDLLGFKLSVEVFTVIAAAVMATFYLFAETTKRPINAPLKPVPGTMAPAAPTTPAARPETPPQP